VKGHVEVVDDGEILDAELSEHFHTIARRATGVQVALNGADIAPPAEPA
jgi:hypothetical protein